MKIMKFVLIFVLFGFVGTLVATFFAPKEHTATTEVVIEQSLEACWNACLNPEIIPNWMDNLDSVRTVYGKFDEHDYVAKFIFSEGEEQSKAHYEIDTVIRHKMVRSIMNLDDKIFLTTTFEFQKNADSLTNIKVTSLLKPKGWMYRLMLSGATEGLESKRENEMEALKKWLENQSTTTAL